MVSVPYWGSNYLILPPQSPIFSVFDEAFAAEKSSTV